MGLKPRSGTVYLLECPFNDGITYIKIGFSARNDLWKRFDELSASLNFQFLWAIRCINASRLERHLHKRFEAKRLDAWQTRELFKLDADDLIYIATIQEFEGYLCRHQFTTYDPDYP